MTENSDWNTLISLFEKLSSLPLRERETHLASLDIADELRERLGRMIRTIDRTVSLVDVPISSKVNIDSGWNAATWLGRSLNDFKLTELLYEGVMSAVFRATQTSPVARDVVVKLVRPNAPKEYLTLFRFEQQALARQGHPNIVTIHDVAATEDGTTYIVMEFIEGATLLDYCDNGKLSIEERLNLFISICGAVTHSHQKGVLHRDLKPSNVLVRNFDGKHSPTIIDFGVAIELNTVFEKNERQLLGTPEYMSPEHVLDPNDMDSRADVYSLGMVLFTLLVGKIPFERSTSSDYETLITQIAKFEVTPPSFYFDELTADEKDQNASFKNSTPSSLNKQLARDIDYIFIKATDKDRELRYQSVADLAADVGQYLNRRPTSAHPNSVLYRGRKFLSRNLAASGGVIVLMVAGSFSLSKLVEQNLRIKQEVLTAQTERKNAEQVASVLSETIQFADPSNGSSDSKATVEGMLNYGYRNLENTLDLSPTVRAELMLAFSTGFRGLDDHDTAKDIHTALLNNSNIDNPNIIAQTYLVMAESARVQSDFSKAIELAEKTYEYAVDNNLRAEHLVKAKFTIGEGYYLIGQLAEANEQLQQALSLYKRNSISDKLLHSKIVYTMGKAAYWSDQYDEADRYYKEARSIISDDYSEQHPSIMRIESSEIGLANYLKRSEKMISRMEKLYENAEKLWGPDAYLTYDYLLQLADTYQANRKWKKAEDAAKKLLVLAEKLEPIAGDLTITTLAKLSDIYFETGRFEDSVEASLRAYDLVKRVGETAPKLSLLRIGITEKAYARSLTIMGDLEQAISAYTSVIEIFTSDENRVDDFAASAFSQRALVHTQLKNFDKAYEDAREGYQLTNSFFPDGHKRVLKAKLVELYADILLIGKESDGADKKLNAIKKLWEAQVAADSSLLKHPQFKFIGEYVTAHSKK